jgi:UDP-glucose 4-epimerase
MLLVTGGAGYIGSHLVKSLKTPVVVVDSLVEGHPESLAPDIPLIQADVGDLDAMKSLFSKYPIEAVIHFAAFCYVGESQEKPQKYFQNNVINTLRLLEAMEEANVRRIVFSSTCATYGHPQFIPLTEPHPQQPINIYGLTKHLVEQALHGYAQTRGWSVACLRYFNASGADETGQIGESHEPETHLIPLILQTALRKRPSISIYGTDYDTPDGTCIRDYIHVADLADAHIKALDYLQNKQGVWEAFNLGTTHGASVKEVIDMCREVTGHPIPVEEVSRRPGDPALLVAQADKALEVLGWKPQFDLRRIIETAWQWEQNRRY